MARNRLLVLSILTLATGTGGGEYSVDSSPKQIPPAEDELALNWRYSYDEEGRIVDVTGPAGNTTRLDYEFAPQDHSLRKITRTHADESKVAAEFDSPGRRIKMTDELGEVVYRYDASDHLVGVHRNGQPKISFSYDTMDRMASLRVGESYELTYSYDVLGRISSIATPAGDISYEYRSGEGVIERLLPNKMRTRWEHSPGGDLQSIAHIDPNDRVVAQFSYSYGANSLVSAITEYSRNGSRYVRYTYDRFLRLKTAEYGDGQKHEYEYDKYGNRTSMLVNGKQIEQHAHNWAGQINGLRYDRAGSLTQHQKNGTATSYEYNSINLLDSFVEGKQSVHYSYDGDGYLAARSVDGRTSFFLRDPLASDWRPIAHVGADGQLTYYVWEAGAPVMSIAGTTPTYYLHDHTGSSRLVIDNAAQVAGEFDYSPYGVPRNLPPSDSLQPGFAGMLFDPVAKIYATSTRFYDPSAGRYLQRAPQSFLAKRLPTSASDYSYAGGDPVNSSDFMGSITRATNPGAIDWEREIRRFDRYQQVVLSKAVVSRLRDEVHDITDQVIDRTFANSGFLRDLCHDLIADLRRWTTGDKYGPATVVANRVSQDVKEKLIEAVREAVERELDLPDMIAADLQNSIRIELSKSIVGQFMNAAHVTAEQLAIVQAVASNPSDYTYEELFEDMKVVFNDFARIMEEISERIANDAQLAGGSLDLPGQATQILGASTQTFSSAAEAVRVATQASRIIGLSMMTSNPHTVLDKQHGWGWDGSRDYDAGDLRFSRTATLVAWNHPAAPRISVPFPGLASKNAILMEERDRVKTHFGTFERHEIKGTRDPTWAERLMTWAFPTRIQYSPKSSFVYRRTSNKQGYRVTSRGGHTDYSPVSGVAIDGEKVSSPSRSDPQHSTRISAEALEYIQGIPIYAERMAAYVDEWVKVHGGDEPVALMVRGVQHRLAEGEQYAEKYFPGRRVVVLPSYESVGFLRVELDIRRARQFADVVRTLVDRAGPLRNLDLPRVWRQLEELGCPVSVSIHESGANHDLAKNTSYIVLAKLRGQEIPAIVPTSGNIGKNNAEWLREAGVRVYESVTHETDLVGFLERNPVVLGKETEVGREYGNEPVVGRIVELAAGWYRKAAAVYGCVTGGGFYNLTYHAALQDDLRQIIDRERNARGNAISEPSRNADSRLVWAEPLKGLSQAETRAYLIPTSGDVGGGPGGGDSQHVPPSRVGNKVDMDLAIDMARLSRAGYQRREFEPFGDGVRGRWEFVKEGYLPSGLHWTLYERRSSDGKRELALAFTGTEIRDRTSGEVIDLRDWLTNLAQGLYIGSSKDSVPGQYADAMRVAEHFIEEADRDPNTSIVLTGHSLAGGLAQYASLHTGVRAYVFNSAPLGIGTQLTNDPLALRLAHKRSLAGSNIVNIYVYGDAVHEIPGAQFGRQIRIRPAPGTAGIDSNYKGGLTVDFVERHDARVAVKGLEFMREKNLRLEADSPGYCRYSISREDALFLLEGVALLEEGFKRLEIVDENLALAGNIKDAYELVSALRDDIVASRKGQVTVLTSHTLEVIARIVYSKIPDIVAHLHKANALPDSFLFPATLGFDDFVVASARHIGRGYADSDTITGYFDSANQAVWAVVGYMVGGPEDAKVFQASANFAAKAVRRLSLQTFKEVVASTSGQREVLLSDWKALQERRILIGLPVLSLRTVYGEELLRQNGLDEKEIAAADAHVAQINAEHLRMKEAIRTEEGEGSWKWHVQMEEEPVVGAECDADDCPPFLSHGPPFYSGGPPGPHPANSGLGNAAPGRGSGLQGTPGASGMLPSNVGGVYLRGAGRAVGALGEVTGVAIDNVTGRIALLSDGNEAMALPPLRLDDLVAVFLSVYDHGGPYVSIDPDPTEPDGPMMLVRHDEGTERTHAGWVMFEADRLMKGYSLGVDNVTQSAIESTVEGYHNLFDLEGPDRENGRIWERFWIVPKEVEKRIAKDNGLALIDVALGVRAQRMSMNGGVLEPASSPEPSVSAAAFAKWFTSHYDEIAREALSAPEESNRESDVRVFSELRRIALIAAVAEWLRDRGVAMPAWMRGYRIPPFDVPRTTPAINVVKESSNVRETTQGNRTKLTTKTMRRRIYGGVRLEPYDDDIRSVNGDGNATGLLEALSKRMQTAPLLSSLALEHDGRRYEALTLPGDGSVDLGANQLVEVDLAVPVLRGTHISLQRRFNSFFRPNGVMGQGWSMDMPRLVASRMPVERSSDKTVFATAYHLTSPLGTSSGFFWRHQYVSEVNAELLVSEDGGPYHGIALAHDEKIGFETRILLRHDGNARHFGKDGYLAASVEGPLMTVYRRDEARRIRRVEGWYGRQLLADIDITYYEDGLMRSARGSNEEEVEYSYTDDGELLTVRREDEERQYRYRDGLVAAVSVNGRTVQSFIYDAMGRLRSAQSGHGGPARTLLARTTNGHLRMDAFGETGHESVEYDRAFRPLRRVMKDGTEVRWDYGERNASNAAATSSNGERYAMTSAERGYETTLSLPNGGSVSERFDGLGRLTGVWRNGRETLTQEWHASGLVASIQQETREIRPRFDGDRILQDIYIVPAGAGRSPDRWMRVDLDARGRAQSVADSAGVETTIGYDERGEAAVLSSNQGGMRARRDEKGRTLVVETSWGARQENTYEADSGLLEEMELTGDTVAKIRFEDGLLRTIRRGDGGAYEVRYHERGVHDHRVKRVKTPNDLEVSYGYDALNRLDSVRIDQLSEIGYRYDSYGRIVGVRLGPVAPPCVHQGKRGGGCVAATPSVCARTATLTARSIPWAWR